MTAITLERCLQIHLAHRHGDAGREARAMARLTIMALRRLRAMRAARAQA